MTDRQSSPTLADAPMGQPHVVTLVASPREAPEWAQWLEEIGFIPGERVTLMARGMLGGDPLVVRIGSSTFALRRAEAACIHVRANDEFSRDAMSAAANSSPLHFHKPGPLIALVGNPNCGKTALFNLLTGGRQKVANYAGVTVERKEGKLTGHGGKAVRVLDLPGAYSLNPRSPDERITTDVLFGRAKGERQPDLVICVLDATNLRRNLRLVLAVRRLGLPCVVALNMADVARAEA